MLPLGGGFAATRGPAADAQLYRFVGAIVPSSGELAVA